MSATNPLRPKASAAFDTGIIAFNAITDAPAIETVDDLTCAMAGFSAQASMCAAQAVSPDLIEDCPDQLNLRASYLRQWATLLIKTADNMNATAAQGNQTEARYDA